MQRDCSDGSKVEIAKCVVDKCSARKSTGSKFVLDSGMLANM